MRRRSRLFYNRSIKWEKDPIIHKNKNKIKKKRSKQTNKQKPASTPEQDLHPDWDRSRATMLYPMRGNFKLISSKWSTYCKEKLHTDYEENWPLWPKYDISSKALLFY